MPEQEHGDRDLVDALRGESRQRHDRRDGEREHEFGYGPENARRSNPADERIAQAQALGAHAIELLLRPAEVTHRPKREDLLAEIVREASPPASRFPDIAP